MHEEKGCFVETKSFLCSFSFASFKIPDGKPSPYTVQKKIKFYNSDILEMYLSDECKLRRELASELDEYKNKLDLSVSKVSELELSVSYHQDEDGKKMNLQFLVGVER